MSLIKNSSYNIAGFVVPTIIAIPALGILARQLGVENFGLFTLAFAIIGYASIFDGGLSRAVIREISIFRGDPEEQKKIISTATVVVIFLGFLASLFLYFFVEHLVNFLNITTYNIRRAEQSFRLLAFVIPFYLVNQVWLAYLEGHESFLNINIQRIISSILISVLPAIFCLFESNLYFAILGLILGRYISFLLTFIICRKKIIESGLQFYFYVFKRLIEFGGWLTISNVISPIMVYFDRFIISNIMGADKIAFYTAPAEAVSRLINIPYALSRALFPKLSCTQNLIERNKLESLSYLLITIVCLPIVIIGLIFAKFILTIWLGSQYAGEAVTVFQILIIGFYFNSLAQIPYSVLQAGGKAKTTAFIHIFEVLPYVIILFYLVYNYGVIGAAIAWSLRTFFDFLLMYYFSKNG